MPATQGQSACGLENHFVGLSQLEKLPGDAPGSLGLALGPASSLTASLTLGTTPGLGGLEGGIHLGLTVQFPFAAGFDGVANLVVAEGIVGGFHGGDHPFFLLQGFGEVGDPLVMGSLSQKVEPALEGVMEFFELSFAELGDFDIVQLEQVAQPKVVLQVGRR